VAKRALVPGLLLKRFLISLLSRLLPDALQTTALFAARQQHGLLHDILADLAEQGWWEPTFVEFALLLLVGLHFFLFTIFQVFEESLTLGLAVRTNCKIVVEPKRSNVV